MITFDDARDIVAAEWRDYVIAPYGYETDTYWILLLLPETAGGRIPLVSKSTGKITWINEDDDRYTQQRPVGQPPARR
jgi:hypothetical protein